MSINPPPPPPSLIHAVEKDDVELVENLLGDINTDVNVVNDDGKTPIQIAANKRYFDKKPNNGKIVDILLADKRTNLNAEDRDGNNILILAAKNGNKTTLSKILNKETVNIDHQNKEGETALLIACGTSIGFENEKIGEEIFDILMSHKANINLFAKRGSTCLLTSLIHNKDNITRKLLKEPNLDVNLGNLQFSALEYSIMRKNSEFVNMILKYPNINITGALNRAERETAPLEIIKALKNKEFFRCVASNNVDRFNALLQDEDVDINTKDGNENTPLMEAIKNGNENFVTELLGKHGINVNAQNKDGHRALDLARINNQTNIISLLKKKSAKTGKFFSSNFAQRRKQISDLLTAPTQSTTQTMNLPDTPGEQQVTASKESEPQRRDDSDEESGGPPPYTADMILRMKMRDTSQEYSGGLKRRKTNRRKKQSRKNKSSKRNRSKKRRLSRRRR